MAALSTAIRAELAAQLAAAGVVATLDPGAVPPFVLVGAAVLKLEGRAGLTATIPVVVCTPPPGDARALRWLEETTEDVLMALSSLEPAIPGPYNVADQACPAYVVTVARTKPRPCP